MFEYYYLICTESYKDKYWTRKVIYHNKKIFKQEDKKYTIKQINKLIKSIFRYQYKKIYSLKLPKIT